MEFLKTAVSFNETHRSECKKAANRQNASNLFDPRQSLLLGEKVAKIFDF